MSIEDIKESNETQLDSNEKIIDSKSRFKDSETQNEKLTKQVDVLNEKLEKLKDERDALSEQLSSRSIEIEEFRYQKDLERMEAEEQKYKERKDDQIKVMYMFMLFLAGLMILVFASINNPGIYIVSQDTMSFISQAFNALVLLIIPFFLGALGAITRVLMSGLNVVKNTTVIISSGMMGMFSWVGIKSGIFISLLAPHVEKSGVDLSSIETSSPSDFYAMALVAIFIGMFSSNVYIMINSRVQQITNSKDEVKNP